ncbi:uncharacterized protein A4U43_C01F18240 [Asparagus officinalis]|uniref:Uncharacterized protein n=1 Tax=Asparagus officinalis TaxID=4686 RepID=A0A5P1FR41_ASPOF|nr:uncharacterized protein A4U43_C01F18240 [Asparagus officinalis]
MFSLKPLNPRNIFPKDLHRPQFLSPPRSNALSFFSSPPKSPTLLHIGPVKYQFSTDNFLQNDKDSAFEKEKQEEIHGDEEKAINGIHVPRQKYISVPKAELLNEILELFDSKEDADEFARLSVWLSRTVEGGVVLGESTGCGQGIGQRESGGLASRRVQCVSSRIQGTAETRPNFLPRITLSNIWKPATKESSGNNIWNTLRTSISILFSQSTLQLSLGASFPRIDSALQ